jgi:hypothetical protein
MLIKLSTQQYEYLNSKLPLKRAGLLKKLKVGQINRNQFELDEDLMDTIRDWAIDRLIEVGLDKDYNLNAEGLILDDLVDLLYI